MSKSSVPKAVLISDIHFTPNTLDLASESVIQAKHKAVELDIPLIIAGDLLDTKAIMRAECVNRLIEIFTEIPVPSTYVLVGNHDLLNEKGTAHSLEFLKPYVTVISDVGHFNGLYMMAYQTDAAAVEQTLRYIPKGSTIICHQGVQSAYMGHYTQDKTSLPKEAFADFRVVSGHYHRRQDIACAEGCEHNNGVGLFSYIGNPYTQNFGEASDPEKGYRVLYEDGSLGFVPTNLRKHVVVDIRLDELPNGEMPINKDDLVWLKLRGPKSELDKINKKKLGLSEFGTENYKLDLISDPTLQETPPVSITSTEPELLDSLINALSEPTEVKTYLKALWRDTLEDSKG